MKPHHQFIPDLPPIPEPVIHSPPMTAGRLRLLKWNEVAVVGDFITNELEGFELWDGPAGFQSGSFVRPIYRRNDQRSPKPDTID